MKKLEEELLKIIDYMNKIKELKLEKDLNIKEKNFNIYLREDTQSPSIYTDMCSSFAPHFSKNYFIVPKII